MHVPKFLHCHTTEATERRWKWGDRGLAPWHTPSDPARICRAFDDLTTLTRHNGTACDGCARNPFEVSP